MAGALDSFVRRNIHALYGTSKILLIPSVALSVVALFTPAESNTRVTALLATSVALHCVGLLVILQGPFFFIMRKSSFSAAIGAIFTLVFTAFVVSMAAGSILAQEKSLPSRALSCAWAMVAVDFINIFVIGATLGRGSDVDEGAKEMVVPENTGSFLTTHRGLLYRTLQLFLAISFGLSIVSSVYRFYQLPSAFMGYVATGFQGIAFTISVTAPFYIPMRKKSITAAISNMLFFTFVPFTLHIAAGAESCYEAIPEFDLDGFHVAFGFGWSAAITDAINFVVFFALLRGLAIDSDAEDIAQSDVRKRRYNALPQIICMYRLTSASIARFEHWYRGCINSTRQSADYYSPNYFNINPCCGTVGHTSSTLSLRAANY